MKEKHVFIPLTDDLVIRTDDNNWMLCKPRGTNKDGSIKWTGFIFCGSLEQLVGQTGQFMLRTCGAQTYTELVKAADDISRLLSQKFTASATVTLRNDK